MENGNKNKSEHALREEKILEFWDQNKIFEETLKKESREGEFVFYEGPPTANGRPGIHHLEARAFKDVIPRYKTMKGFHVRRKAGWDTHGLPVELQVEKSLGLSSKKQVEDYGIVNFNKKCKESVLQFIDEFHRFTKRMGYWVDQKDAYFTFDNSYIESVWNVVSEINKKNLLYKDYKVLPWCPRCGTALSSHELAQGYKDVKDLSVYVKFKVVGEENTYILAWTTTPWTLPGNVALAVGENVDYVKAKLGGEILIVAKERIYVLGEGYEILEELKGKDLFGLSYEPLYPFLKDNISGDEKGKLPNAFKVYGADFVTTTDGTGIVHTAVMYGQDDFALGTKVGLPKYHLVKEDGHFKDDCGFLSGRFVKEVDENGKPTLAVDIIDDLKKRNLFFKQENYKHSYPHCWRCNTPLIYFARDSWYIAMSKLRDTLVKENEKINWEPSHIKNGRFGEWLREIKDWAISRERYWGTPLPVWENADKSERVVVDSIQTLKDHTKKSGNKYFVMRHGEASHNVEGVFSSDEEKIHELTEKGKLDAKKTALLLKDKKIDLIFYSPLKRTKQTAEIVNKELGSLEMIEEPRIREEGFGGLSGKKIETFTDYFKNFDERLSKVVEGCEPFLDVKKRVGEFLYEIENKYKDKNVLIVTHDGPAKLMKCTALGVSKNEIEKCYHAGEIFIPVGNFVELDFVPLPHNEDFELDLHKPFIDEIELVSKDGQILKRTKEVMDVWFDSGAMPFAQDHYPFENKKLIDSMGFPADYISEAIDQTRGWFYTLHAVGVLMGKGRAYKNVICLGHLNDKDGKKMSKSVGNIVDPFEMMDKYGADALRLWMYSINQPGETKNFDEKTVDEIIKKVFNPLSNVYAFYELFRDKNLEANNLKLKANSFVLDEWIIQRLNEVINKNTKYLDSYKLLEPVRELREFIEDLSTWYLRRSRDRIKEGDKEAKQTLYFVLKTISKLLAPFAPFYAEDLYQKLRLENDEKSVHLEEWPQTVESGKWKVVSRWWKTGNNTIQEMQKVRNIVSLALEARQKADIKVRQPLQQLSVKEKLGGDFLEVIKEEVNVKEVVCNEDQKEEVVLDTNITAELKEEGSVREIIRTIQDLRKKEKLLPKDNIVLSVDAPDSIKVIIEKYKKEIFKVAGVESVIFENLSSESVSVGDQYIKISIRK